MRIFGGKPPYLNTAVSSPGKPFSKLFPRGLLAAIRPVLEIDAVWVAGARVKTCSTAGRVSAKLVNLLPKKRIPFPKLVKEVVNTHVITC